MQRKAPQTSDIDDETLFAKVERGDVEAFTAVYNKYHKLLYALAYRYLMSSAMAEDAVQHVFTRFWEFRSELRVGISLRNYLITMTKNHILNVIRNENTALTKNYEIAQGTPAYEDTLVDSLEKKELMSIFYKAVDMLPPQKREICLMKVREELSNQEIADRLKLSINTIKTHYSDALKLLRVHLGKLLIFVTYLTLLRYLSVYLTVMSTENMNTPTEKQIQEVLAGTSTPEVARIVAAWFATDEGAAYLAKSMDRDAVQIKQGFEELYVNHEIPSEEMFARIRRNIRQKRIRRITFRVAAVLIPFVLLIGLFVQVNTRVDLLGDSGYEEIYVPKGERLQMMFQDGTRAYINSDSRLKYPKKFALSSREVYLEGEAYFVVSKNSHRPFIVNLNGPAVHVLGTSFDVQAYPENKDITVCLDEGRVNLTLASDKKYPLKPGEKLVYNKESERCTITRHADIHLSSLWKKNVIAFKDAPLSEVIKVLNRWYDVDFKIEDQSAWDVYFTITSENTLLEKVLQDLEKIAPLRFEYKEAEKEVIVTRKKEDSRLMH